MKRTAFGVWRCAGATSPGSRYWTAMEIVWPAVRSGTPGLSRRTMRRSAPRPGEVQQAPAPLGPGPAPRHGARVAFLHVGRRRREAVDADAVAHQVHGGGPREVEQPALARAVADVAGLALMAGRGHDHDDAA